MKIKEWIDRYRIKLNETEENDDEMLLFWREQLERKEMNASLESLATQDFSTNRYSYLPIEVDPKVQYRRSRFFSARERFSKL
ncbi:hypothetical protein HanRHA438_Chr15g0696921 [Helianthus annuus]|nr:hypothetical protein HanIR_Chr15g0744031 [Helianthus annuus]KAJ0843942.1 hypothetical protein HanRHA438_Chr15g0696921 [Helianthus annuus]